MSFLYTQQKHTKIEKEISIIEYEMQTAESLSKQFLEGKLFVLKELYKNDIDIPKSLQSNYTIEDLKKIKKYLK